MLPFGIFLFSMLLFMIFVLIASGLALSLLPVPVHILGLAPRSFVSNREYPCSTITHNRESLMVYRIDHHPLYRNNLPIFSTHRKFNTGNSCSRFCLKRDKRVSDVAQPPHSPNVALIRKDASSTVSVWLVGDVTQSAYQYTIHANIVMMMNKWSLFPISFIL